MFNVLFDVFSFSMFMFFFCFNHFLIVFLAPASLIISFYCLCFNVCTLRNLFLFTKCIIIFLKLNDVMCFTDRHLWEKLLRLGQKRFPAAHEKRRQVCVFTVTVVSLITGPVM